jgi:hypothetical protein
LITDTLFEEESSPEIFQEVTQKEFMPKGFLSVPVDQPTVVRQLPYS